MKTLEIKGNPREKTGKKFSKYLRTQEQVPCVLYGGDKIVHFYAHEITFLKVIYTSETYLIKLDIDGDKYDAIIQEIQFDPVTDKPIHIDFLQTFEDKPMILEIPLRLTGDSVGLLGGGKLRQRRRYLKVKGLVKHIPEILDVDITHLDIGDFIKIEDLEYENLELLDPPRAMVAGVISSRVVAKGLEIIEEEEEVEEVVEGEEGAEGEAPAEGAAEGEEDKQQES